MQMLLRNHAAMPLNSRNGMRSIVHSAVAALRTPGSGEGHTTVKRKIALHLGYVGTNYKGEFLQPSIECIGYVIAVAISEIWSKSAQQA